MDILYWGDILNDIEYIIIKIYKNSGDIEIMGKNDVTKDNKLNEILEIYEKMHITVKREEYDYKNVMFYDYNQKSILDVNSYAKI